MKKSEMVNKIAKTLNNLRDVKLTTTLTAEIILNEVLSEGMLPPLSTRFIRTLEFEGETTSNEWDAEATVAAKV